MTRIRRTLHRSPWHCCGVLTFGCGDPSSPPTAPRASPRALPVPVALDSLTAVADSLYRDGDYARAKEAWSAGLAPHQSRAGPRGRGTGSHFARIRPSGGSGEYEAARARTEQARALLESQRPPRASLPRTYNALGLIAWDQGRLSEAADLWRRTMQIAREVGDQEYVDKPAMNLGLWYAGIGDLEHAREAFAASLTAGRKLGIRPLELRSLVNLAMVANRMGEPRLALAWLDSAAAAGVEEDFLAEDNYRSQLAIAAWALGDPGVALAGLDSAVRDARRRRPPAIGGRQPDAPGRHLLGGRRPGSRPRPTRAGRSDPRRAGSPHGAGPEPPQRSADPARRWGT